MCVPCQEAERKSRAEKAREPSRSGVQAIGCGCGRVRKALRLGWSWGGSHCSTPQAHLYIPRGTEAPKFHPPSYEVGTRLRA